MYVQQHQMFWYLIFIWFLSLSFHKGDFNFYLSHFQVTRLPHVYSSVVIKYFLLHRAGNSPVRCCFGQTCCHHPHEVSLKDVPADFSRTAPGRTVYVSLSWCHCASPHSSVLLPFTPPLALLFVLSLCHFVWVWLFVLCCWSPSTSPLIEPQQHSALLH